jgi:hypothetical protein
MKTYLKKAYGCLINISNLERYWLDKKGVKFEYTEDNISEFTIDAKAIRARFSKERVKEIGVKLDKNTKVIIKL